MAHPGGRPTKYSKELLQKAIDFFNNIQPYYEVPVDKQDAKTGNVTTTMQRQANSPLVRRKLANHLGLAMSTIYDWEENNPEFSEAIKKAEARLFEEFLPENGLTGAYSQPFAIFAAKNKLGWTDKTTTESTQNINLNIPKEITFVIKRPDNGNPDTGKVTIPCH
jgi:hypothetical protein